MSKSWSLLILDGLVQTARSAEMIPLQLVTISCHSGDSSVSRIWSLLITGTDASSMLMRVVVAFCQVGGSLPSNFHPYFNDIGFTRARIAATKPPVV